MGGDGTPAQPIGVWDDGRLWFNGCTVYMGTGNKTYNDLQIDAINSGNIYALPKGGGNSLFVCPSATEAQADQTQTGDIVVNGLFMATGYDVINKNGPSTSVRPMLLCYGMNSQLRTKKYESWQTYYAPVNEIGDIPSINALSPAAMIPLVAEKRIRQDELAEGPPSDPNRNKAMTQSKVTANRFSARHNKGGNMVMADGHTEWFNNTAINKGQGANSANYYNIPNVVIWNPSGK